jgi:hypothetical protein
MPGALAGGDGHAGNRRIALTSMVREFLSREEGSNDEPMV